MSLLLFPSPTGPSGSPGAIADITSNLDLVSLSDITATGTAFDSVVAFNCADRLNDITDFSLTVAYDTTTMPAFGDVVRLKLGGTIVWAGIIERKQTHPVAQGEEAEENVVFLGRSLGCVMDRIAVRPALGFGTEPWAPTRVFGMGDPNVDISGWDPAVELGLIGEAQTYWPAGQPAGFPGLNVQGIGTTGDTTAGAAQGYRPLAKDWTLASDSAVAMFFTADNSADVDADGFRVASITAGADTTEGLRSCRAVTFFFAAGTHRVTAKLVNVPFGGGDPGWGTGPTLTGNPTRFAAVGYKVDSAGRLGDKVFETDDTWVGLATPSSPPGQGLGEIATLIRSANSDLSPSFTFGFDETGDTDTTAWPVLETLTTNVGDSFLKLARDWSLLYWTWRFNYSTKELDAWVIDTYTEDSGVTYFLSSDPEGSGVADLQTDQLDVGTDALIVQYQGGQIRVPASGGSRLGFFKSNAVSAAEATSEGEQVLAAQGQPEQLSVQIVPTGTGDIPGKDCLVGQLVSVADGTGVRVEKLVEWTASLPAGSDEWEFGITVKDRHLQDLEALSRHLQRMENGTMGGTAPSAPSGPPPPSVAKVSASELTFHLQRETIIGESPAHKFPTTSGNIYGVKISIPTRDADGFDIVTTGDTSVDLWARTSPPAASGVIGSVTIPAGTNLAVAAVDPIFWVDSNQTEIWPEVTAAAAEAVELTVEPLTV